MSFFVFFQITWSVKFLSTSSAFVCRFFVKFHVRVQATRRMKLFPTLHTLILWFRMDEFHVSSQNFFCFEESSFRTDWTPVFSFIAVSSLVSLQLPFCSKPLATSRTRKWFRTCVNSTVNSKFWFTQKKF